MTETIASEPAGSAHVDDEPRPGRWLALAVLVLAVLLVGVDATVLGLATPFLSEDLRPSGTQLLWIGDIYSFVIAGLLVSMGSLGDRIGRKKLLLIGSVGFGAMSVLAAYASTPEMMIAARALQGVAGATLMPSTLALIRNLFHDPKERSLAIGIWGAMASAKHGRGTGARRLPAGALLVGFGLPDQPAGDGAAGGRRRQGHPGVAQSGSRPLGHPQRAAGPGGHRRRRLRHQGSGGGGLPLGHRAGGRHRGAHPARVRPCGSSPSPRRC